MYQDSFKEDIGSGLYCDALLAGNQNHHLRKAINNQKNKVISHMVDGRFDMYSQSLSKVGRGVYKPRFLVAILEITKVVQDRIYLLTSCRSFTK